MIYVIIVIVVLKHLCCHCNAALERFKFLSRLFRTGLISLKGDSWIMGEQILTMKNILLKKLPCFCQAVSEDVV